MVRIAQASQDERGKYTGGDAGNQSGSELVIRTWYNRPWDTVLRAIDKDLAEKIAQVAQRIVRCTKIGYDQGQRTSLYDQCEKIGWDLSRIDTISPCECDCSSMIAVVLMFCGISIPKTVYTGNLEYYVMATGKFISFKDNKYLTTDEYLCEGDFVLNTQHHVAVVLDNGSKVQKAPFTAYAARVNVSSFLNVRTAPGTWNPIFKINGKDFILPNGLVVAIVEEDNGWGRLSDIQGWVSLSYLQR